jgi:hypothetical protein
LTSEQTASPRLLLWDGVAMNRAKVVKVDPVALTPSPFYNPDSTPYLTLNTFQFIPDFIYNFDMYFESKFEDNLFDRFHEQTDNPLLSKDSNRTFEFKTDLCCEILDILGVWDGEFVKIGALIKIEQRANFDYLGRIEHIEVDHQSERVRLRGKLLKVKT